MSTKIQKTYLELNDWKTEAFLILPSEELLDEVSSLPSVYLWAHGYTSHKGALLNWAIRLAEEGRPSLVLDLPGHYLGSFNEVTDFDAFKQNAHKMFVKAKENLSSALDEKIDSETTTWVLGGHSLGGLLSLKALELQEFQELKTRSLAVGLGMPPKGKLHIFDTPFYKSTLLVREQLVSPALDSQSVFSWIKEEKNTLKLSNQKVSLICGEDDTVVGKEGADLLKELLESQGNEVILEKPRKLPHHQPELAAAHIKKHIKDLGL
ncbi:MAG: hypothetical protein ACPGJV_05265 [Bacteriovoracaceae bacterium]